MAVLEMERVQILAMKRDRKKILELLQRRGTLEVREPEPNDEIFRQVDTSTIRTLLSRNIDTVSNALEILHRHSPEKSSMFSFLEGRKPLPAKAYDEFYDRQEEVLSKAQRITAMEREITEAKAERIRVEALLEALTPWMRLPVPQKCTGTKKTAVFVGAVPGAHSLQELLEKLSATAQIPEAFHLEIVDSSPEQTCLLGIALKKDAAAAEEALRSIGFARPSNPSHHLPEKKKQLLNEQMEKADRTVADNTKAIQDAASYREEFRLLSDHLQMRREKYEVLEKLSQSKHVFVLDGYIPLRDQASLEAELAKRYPEAAVEFSSAAGDDNAPTVLRNNWVSEPVETVLESYSLPGKGEIDPTPVMSFFYYFMFGMMFGDAGYGLILIVACGLLLLKFRNMEPNWSKNLRLFFLCGVTTTFWGVVFSSYFGDVVDVVSATFFGNKISIPPLWFLPMELPMKMLVFALACGLVHLFSGLGMKGYTLLKSGQVKDFLYDVIFPFGFVASLLTVLVGTSLFQNLASLNFVMPPVLNTALFAVAGICALGILLTSGRESRNWGKRLLKGIYGLYNAFAGWLSDLLSYSRLLALGLASGVIAQVVNKMGAMGGSGIAGVILFVVVFALGHSLNFGIEALGAYVHTNRLQFVEFFGKFYEGGGRKMEPFAMHTKYYKFEEDTQNG